MKKKSVVDPFPYMLDPKTHTPIHLNTQESYTLIARYVQRLKHLDASTSKEDKKK